MTCLDHLGAGLALYAEQKALDSHVYDTNNRLRMIIDPLTFRELLYAAFNMIRRASRENPDVLLSLLDAIETIGRKSGPERKAELLRHVRLVEAESRASTAADWDRERVGRRCTQLADSLVH
jgi:uncharacterized membrane protein